jgi:three-Cys-motif partner protein
VLLTTLLPGVKYEERRRALCLLDPYGLHLNWPVIEAAGRMNTVEIFLNFPVADMNRNVLWREPAGVDPADVQRMTAFWGDESWREAAYDKSSNLFGWPEKTTNETIAESFRRRLERVASFSYVPNPVPMRNSIGRVVYCDIREGEGEDKGDLVQGH